jgi:prepilin-type N-terminal cleavage/methylation domain-containing protein/prepilin-type processing-associated H-X9-DG protein
MNKTRAFTLIELLVVIAITGLLLSLLIPALGTSVQLAHTTRCQSNQRSLVTAAMGYRNDHGIHPPAIYYEQVDGTWNIITWEDVVWEYCTTTESAMACPEHVHVRGGSGSGYNYNTDFIGAEAGMLQGLEDAPPGIAPSACKHPSHTAMFGDGGEIAGDMGGYTTNRFMRSPKENDGGMSCAGSQSFRHRGATVVGWLDGHVSSEKTRFESNCQYDLWETNGFLSEDDAAYDPRMLTLGEITN